MSYISYSDHIPLADSRTSFSRAISPLSYLGQLANAIVVKMAERANREALADLEDHQLFDIGIQRSEIRDLAREAAADPGIEHRSLR